jgi:hypothetical protein
VLLIKNKFGWLAGWLAGWCRAVAAGDWDTPQKCHFTLGFCMLNFLIAGCLTILE